MADKVELGKIKLPTLITPESMLAEIERQLEVQQGATAIRKLAQGARQERYGIRGGGAPASKPEARQMIQAAVSARQAAAAVMVGIDLAHARKLLEEAIRANKALNEYLADARLVILFKSGGPFIYTSSLASDYALIVSAPSKGKWVWRRGWGPDRSPSYSSYASQPDKVIADEAVSSTWLLHVWLVIP
jgi:hypothetical protein